MAKEVVHPMLSEEVDVKEYGQVNVNMTEQEKNSSIPEPSFDFPPDFQDEPEFEESQSSPKRERKEQVPFNESMEDMTPTESKKSAEGMAKMAMMVYEYLHKFPNDAVKFNEDKIRVLHNKGDINLSARITLPDNTNPTLEDFIKQYNYGMEGSFTVSQEFKDEVMPLLTRILKKKGVGLTDEEQLAFLVVMDLFQKGNQFFMLYKVKKDTLEQLKDISKSLRTTGATVVTPPSVPKKEDKDEETHIENVKNDGTVEIVEVVGEDNLSSKKSGRGRPSKK